MFKKIMSKKGIAVLLIALLLQTIFPISTIFAEDVPFQFFAQVSLTDGDGNAFSGAVSQDSEVNIRYDYSIPDEYSVDTSKTYTLNIPDEIKITSGFSINLYDNDDPTLLIAIVNVDTDNTISINFTSDVNDKMYDRSGWFRMELSFNKDEITNQTQIVFPLGAGATTAIQIQFEPDEETVTVDMNKTGTYDSETNEITWQIVVKPSTKPDVRPISNVTISDAINSDQEFVGGSLSILPEDTACMYAYNDTLRRIICSFTDDINNTAGEQYIITYKTKADTSLFTTEDATVTFSNQARSTYDGGGPSFSNTATASVKTDFVKKSGTYLASTKQIRWTVTVNNNYLPIDNAVISDTIQSGLTLVQDSVTVDGVSTEVTPSGPLTYTGTTLAYAFDAQINEPHILEYLTDVTDPDAYNSNTSKTFTNSATLTGTGVTATDASGAVTVGVPTSVISKRGVSYNHTTHEITWEITVNGNKINIQNPVVGDNIPIGLEYVDGSVLINGIAPASGDFVYTPADEGDSTKTGSFTYSFPSALSDSAIITFKTVVLSNTVYAANKNTQFTNRASLSGSNIPTSNTSANFTVQSRVLNKTSVNYNYNTREITWRVVVNQNNMPMDNVVVSDIIGQYQSFVNGSVTINGSPANVGATQYTLNSYYYDSELGMLIYNFPAQITTQQIIEFKTKITDLTVFNTTGSVNISNTANLSGADVPPGVSSSTTRTINNTLVGKTGAYQTGNSYIDWEVVINQNKLTIADAELSDVLQAGLALDADSIELWKINLPDNGVISLSGAEKIAITSNNVVYDITTNTFTFKFLNTISDAYILKFRTDIGDAYRHATYTNSIEFTGSSIDQSSTSSAIPVAFLAGSGGAMGTVRGNLTVVKVDKDNTEDTLSGAQFQLLDIYGNVLATSAVTGENGEALFSSLRLDRTYYIKEIVAPTGYVLDESLREIGNLNDENGSTQNITYTFENEKIIGNIKIIKANEDGIYLKNAEFTLYSGDDINFENPLKTAISNNLGEAVFENLEYGAYKIIETKAPDGYKINTDVMEFNVTQNGQTLSMICINEKIPHLPKTGQGFIFEGIGLILILFGTGMLLRKRKNV